MFAPLSQQNLTIAITLLPNMSRHPLTPLIPHGEADGVAVVVQGLDDHFPPVAYQGVVECEGEAIAAKGFFVILGSAQCVASS